MRFWYLEIYGFYKDLISEVKSDFIYKAQNRKSQIWVKGLNNLYSIMTPSVLTPSNWTKKKTTISKENVLLQYYSTVEVEVSFPGRDF